MLNNWGLMGTRIKYRNAATGRITTCITEDTLDSVIRAVNAALGADERWLSFAASDGKARAIVVNDIIALDEVSVADALRELSSVRDLQPVAYIQELAEIVDIRAHEMRHVRARELQTGVRQLTSIRSIVEFADDMLFSGRRAYVDVDGVWIDCTDDAYYLRGAHKRSSIGRRIAEVLEAELIQPSTILDIGAYRGEAALWLAKHYPKASVHAVEGSSATAAVLVNSLDTQAFHTTNITIHNHAIGASDGVALFSVEQGTENKLLDSAGSASERVAVKSLETFLLDNRIDNVDFAKIDIEGAEPLLASAFSAMSDRFAALLIEFSIYGEREGYVALAEVLLECGFHCHFDRRTRLDDRGAVEKHLAKSLDEEGRSAIDLWFLRPRDRSAAGAARSSTQRARKRGAKK